MWIPVGDNRWDWDADEDRHLLLLDPGSGVFAELHMQWRHRYRAPEQLDAEWPLNGAVHVDTVELQEPIATDEQGWQILAAAAVQVTP